MKVLQSPLGETITLRLKKDDVVSLVRQRILVKLRQAQEIIKCIKKTKTD